MATSNRKKIAAIITTYFQHSHADVIATKYMTGFPTDTGHQRPRVELVSLYLDQVDDRDIGVGLAAAHQVPIYPSIRQALTQGGDELAVDGVLLIGEHGDYPYNEFGQHMYPRRYLFEQICGVFASSGRSAPVFCDKHLAYAWEDALWMYERANALKVPFMAGSSLPLAWRIPFLEHPLESRVESAIAIGYGGVESYGFHALETQQCMIERRAGGESGVTAVQCLEGDAVWEAGASGDWSIPLAEQACEAIATRPDTSFMAGCEHPTAFLLEHQDGFRSAVLMLNGYVSDFAYAAVVDGTPVATEVRLAKGPPYPHFSYLCLNIEEMFLTGEPQYPVERTLLVTGVLDALMHSRAAESVRVETPHLADIRYRSYEKPLIRPV